MSLLLLVLVLIWSTLPIAYCSSAFRKVFVCIGPIDETIAGFARLI